MPYLYAKAVEAHETGVPMMRPMMLEFPDDPACETLDREYMLGDALLVAPVFSSSGEVTYYVPEGTWLNILTGEKVSHGWHKGTFDFLSLPLLQRPGTVIPFGPVETRPDYDYTDGLELQAYDIPEGAEITVKIPDTKGNTAMTCLVKKQDGRIIAESSSGKPSLKIL